jgi:pantoate--beta-alanine ligase
MRLLESVADFQAWRRAASSSRIGFVPTMGALHVGHQSLIEHSVSHQDLTVLSIYVNPTQFDSADDLRKYPSLLEADLAIARAAGVDAVFLPRYAEIYADGFAYAVDERHISKTLCGAHRDGHFTGVLTIVMKLLSLVRPAAAYFGEKDYQQFELIRGMASAFFLEVQIVACPTVREPSGLALSSRNLNLDANGQSLAPRLHELISSTFDDAEVVHLLTELGFNVDYVVTQRGRRFAAARLGSGANQVRLIDNVEKISIDQTVNEQVKL